MHRASDAAVSLPGERQAHYVAMLWRRGRCIMVATLLHVIYIVCVRYRYIYTTWSVRTCLSQPARGSPGTQYRRWLTRPLGPNEQPPPRDEDDVQPVSLFFCIFCRKSLVTGMTIFKYSIMAFKILKDFHKTELLTMWRSRCWKKADQICSFLSSKITPTIHTFDAVFIKLFTLLNKSKSNYACIQKNHQHVHHLFALPSSVSFSCQLGRQLHSGNDVETKFGRKSSV
mgnify:CR=1 FL=1